jgi:hypothetical protein
MISGTVMDIADSYQRQDILYFKYDEKLFDD